MKKNEFYLKLECSKKLSVNTLKTHLKLKWLSCTTYENIIRVKSERKNENVFIKKVWFCIFCVLWAERIFFYYYNIRRWKSKYEEDEEDTTWEIQHKTYFLYDK